MFMSSCPLCASTGAKETFRFFRPRTSDPTGRPTESLYGRAGRLVRCTGCGLVRQDPTVSAPYEQAEDTTYLEEEAGIRATFRETLERIARYRQPPGRLLDVGCGPGLLLDEARLAGWEAVGLEPSAWAVGEARRRGLDVHEGTTDSVQLAPDSFDVVVAADVIEHVPDPLKFGRRLEELLCREGVAFVCTPNVGSAAARLLRRWWWSVLPGHLFYFTPSTLAAALEGAGLKVLETTTHPKTFSLDYYAGRLTGYSPLLARTARAATKLVGGPYRLVTPDFRDRIALIAKKPS
jgi:2-polyprenyl-3-methyl-5-hydroxy-6-metoxy-1,4-benzoquinol methylase